jgi:hypothetical protein
MLINREEHFSYESISIFFSRNSIWNVRIHFFVSAFTDSCCHYVHIHQFIILQAREREIDKYSSSQGQGLGSVFI